jgi:glutaredoxin
MLMLAVPSVSAEVYKWRDAEGRTHFGDKPPADAATEEVRIRTFAGPAEVSDAPASSAGAVTILTTTWCGVCRRAKAWLAEKGIAYTELDVEKSDAGKSEYRRLGGAGVPIILVGQQRMNGFSPERLEQMLKQLAR